MGGKEYLTRLHHLGHDQLVACLKGKQPGNRWVNHLEACLECQSRLANLRVKSLFDDGHPTATDDGHPTAKQVQRYAENDLTNDEVEAFEVHLGSCSSCRELVELVASVERAQMTWQPSKLPTVRFAPAPALVVSTLKKTTKMLRKAPRKDKLQKFAMNTRSFSRKDKMQVSAMFDQSVAASEPPPSDLPSMLWEHPPPNTTSLGEWRVVRRDQRTVFVPFSASPNAVSRQLEDAHAMLPETFDALRNTLRDLTLADKKMPSARFAKAGEHLSTLKGLKDRQSLWQQFGVEAGKQVAMAEAITHTLSGALAEQRTLTAQVGDLDCRVTAETLSSQTGPFPTGIALTVDITGRSRGSAPGILVVLLSANETIDRVTDTQGRVVFPPVLGRVTLRLGHSEFSLDLKG